MGKKRHHRATLAALLLLAPAAGLLPGGSAPARERGFPSFRIVPLGGLGGRTSTARAVNERGVVVGEAENARGERRAFVWEGGRLRELGTLPGDRESVARAVNRRGWVAGSSRNARGDWRAVVWADGKIYDLGTLGGRQSWAIDINDRGIVVGSSQVPKRDPGDPTARAFAVYFRRAGKQPLRMRRLPDPVLRRIYTPPILISSVATAVSPDGLIAGYGHVHDPDVGHARHLLVWGRFGAREVSWGDTDWWVEAINRSRKLVGFSASEGFVCHDAWIWRAVWPYDFHSLMRRKTIEHPKPGLRECLHPRDINDRDMVVGSIYGESHRRRTRTHRAFLAKNGWGVRLDRLLPEGSGWRLYGAFGINNRGQIVGRGSYRGSPPAAFLMTPARPL